MGNNSIGLPIGIAVLAFLVTSLRTARLATLPSVLHNASWAIALLVVGSGLIHYDRIPVYGWVLITGAIVTFNIGIAFSGRPRSSRVVEQEIGTPLVSRLQYRVLIVGFSIGFVLYLATISQLFGLNTLLSDPTSIRAYSGINYLEVFPLYGKILFYLGPVCFVLTVFPGFLEQPPNRFARGLIIIYLSVAQVATLQRTNLFVCLLWIAGVAVLRLQINGSRKRQWKPAMKQLLGLLTVAIVGLGVFQGIAVALGKTGNNNEAVSYTVDARLQGGPLTSLLYYSSSGVAAFGKLVESSDSRWPPGSGSGPIYGSYNPQTWGRASFTGPLKVLPDIRHWEEVAPFVFTPAPTNVYTWLEPWYRDFRGVGVVLASFLMGIVLGSLARVSGRRPELLLLAGLLIGFSGLAAFVNKYMVVMSVVLYIVLWGLGRSRRRRAAREIRGPRLISRL